MKVIEDGQRLPPGVTRAVSIACGLARVAEVVKDDRLVEQVAEITRQLQRMLVTGSCLVIISQVVFHVAETVPGSGLAILVTEVAAGV
jgi:hypothetical protein